MRLPMSPAPDHHLEIVLEVEDAVGAVAVHRGCALESLDANTQNVECRVTVMPPATTTGNTHTHTLSLSLSFSLSFAVCLSPHSLSLSALEQSFQILQLQSLHGDVELERFIRIKSV